MASVTVQNADKSYGKVPVLRDVSIDIPDGEFIILVGPSGCGKSTLLRMIAGLESVSKGTIRIGDRIVNDVPPARRDVAMVFQNYALYPHMTVLQNMSFALDLSRAPKDEVQRKVAHAAAILGLESLLERYPRHLSGGQRQRVAMGRSIVRDPAVFLFDEPLSNLDAKLRVQMRTEIKELQPLELYDRPNNRFVAGFIGSPAMNFLAGAAGQGTAFVTATGRELPLAEAPALAPGQPTIYGIRPEHLRLSDTGLPATVAVVEPTGSETHVVARHGSEEIVCLLRERVSVRPGQAIHLAMDAANAHLFDAGSGQRVSRALS